MLLHSPNRLRSPANPAGTPHRFRQFGTLRAVLACSLFLSLPPSADGQISLTTAVDLALRSNPRVLGAKDDVNKAQAQLSQARDAYIPAVSIGAGLGQAYGYLPSPPTLATATAGSVVFSVSQFDYIRSARSGLNAALLALQDVQEAVAQDTALAFIALDNDERHEQVVRQQNEFASALVTIVQERVDAGQDTQIDLTQAKLTAAQLRLSELKEQDDIDVDRDHLARLIGLPAASLQTDGNFPAIPVPSDATNPTPNGYANSAVAAAFASAEAKRQQAKGQARSGFWPEINFVAQYNRYATFTNSFGTLETFSGAHIGADEAAFGVQISLPFFDKGRSARGRVAAAEASRALHDAQSTQIDALDSQTRLRHTIDELRAQAEVATLQQQLAQQQLDILRIQLQSGNGNPNGPQMSPKDEQTARIAERDKYLAVLDASFQLLQTEIQLLRQSGELESWFKSVISAPTNASPQNSLPASPAPRP
ncbi:MAG: TolC family protein [Acidobacteriaceae bacterium]|jgi:outer membrane protein TolC